MAKRSIVAVVTVVFAAVGLFACAQGKTSSKIANTNTGANAAGTESYLVKGTAKMPAGMTVERITRITVEDADGNKYELQAFSLEPDEFECLPGSDCSNGGGRVVQPTPTSPVSSGTGTGASPQGETQCSPGEDCGNGDGNPTE